MENIKTIRCCKDRFAYVPLHESAKRTNECRLRTDPVEIVGEQPAVARVRGPLCILDVLLSKDGESLRIALPLANSIRVDSPYRQNLARIRRNARCQIGAEPVGRPSAQHAG
jgi:hypothetical protein